LEPEVRSLLPLCQKQRITFYIQETIHKLVRLEGMPVL